MTSTEINDLRQRVLEVADEWVQAKTPWHHEAMVKGAGVDCAKFLLAVFSEVGIIPNFDVAHYPPDWFLHRNEALYLERVLQFAIEQPEGYEPQPADVILFKIGRQFAHGAIVVKWPIVVHVEVNRICNYMNTDQDRRYMMSKGKPRPYKIFIPKRFL